MSYKRGSYWFKGAIATCILFLVYAIYVFAVFTIIPIPSEGIDHTSTSHQIVYATTAPFFFITYLPKLFDTAFLKNNSYSGVLDSSSPVLTAIVLILLLIFVIGAIIGLILGLFKRKEVRNRINNDL